MGKVRVFYLINSLTLGGAERQMAELVRRLPRNRFEPILCLIDGTIAYRHILPADQPRYVVGSPVGISRALRLIKILREEKPHIIHSFMEYSNFWARILGRLSLRPIIFTSVRSRMMRLDYALMEPFLSKWSDAILVNSVGTRDELVRWQHVKPEKIFLVRNIVDLERFRPFSTEEREEARRKMGVQGTVFLLPGRISLAKNHLLLCASVARAISKGYVRREDIKILLAGRIYDTYVAKTFSAGIKALNIRDVFVYLGPVKEVEKLYAAADFVLLPSLYEGLPNAALEAHACGIPLLMSESANLDRIMEPEVTGFEFKTLSIESMAQAIGRAVQTTQDERRRMGEEGRKRVLRRFDPEESLNDTLSIYERFILERGVS